MKSNNFKINKNVASKLAACVLVGSLAATMLTGCSDRDNILKGTILENSCVVTFADGSKDIAVAIGSCWESCEYHHYYSITSGEYFGDKKCTKDRIEGTVVHHYGITNEENITEKKLHGQEYFMSITDYQKIYTPREILNTQKMLEKSKFDFHQKRGELFHYPV